MGNNVFDGCTGLMSAVLDEGLTNIPSGTFNNCSSLTNIALPQTLSKIGDNAFNNCGALSQIDFPAGLTEIGDFAFEKCSSLKSVTFNENLQSIGWRAFCLCTGITEAILPDKLSNLGTDAFSTCTALEKTKIPASIRSIGSGVFRRCPALKKVYSMFTNPPAVSDNFFDGINSEACLYMPQACLQLYADNYWFVTIRYFGLLGVWDVNLPQSELALDAGESFSLKPEIILTDYASVKSQTWSSDNTDIVTVDDCGNLLALEDGTATVTFEVVDNFDYHRTVTCDVTVTGGAGIENVGADVIETEYFDLKGLRVNPDNLTPGVYIRRQGATTSKVVVQ